MFGDAIAYNRFMGRWSRLAAPLLIDLADLPETGSVLEVGSGTGSLAFAIARHRPHCRVLGIDMSKEYVAYAASQAAGAMRVTFEVGDARQLRFADASFERTLSLLILNFVPDPAKAVAEMVRVTKPDGLVVAAVWDYGEEMRMLRLFWDSAVSVDPQAEAFDEKRMPLCRPGELSALWEKSGLTGVEEQPLQITMHFSGFQDYWHPFLLGQGPAGAYVRRLRAVDVEKLRNEVKRRLPVSSENEPFDLPARLWAVRGLVPRPPGAAHTT